MAEFIADKECRILLLEGIHSVAKERLERAGMTVDLHKAALNERELGEHLTQYDAVGIRSKTQITHSVLEKASNLWAVGAFCIGTNQVDILSAGKMGIPVFNAPYSNTRSVAEMVVSHMVSLARRLSHVSHLAHKGLWQKTAAGSHEVRGKTLGIVGYGHIGSQLSVLAEALGLRVVYFDIARKLPLGNATPLGSLEALLAVSDFISLHVPETTETRNMISYEQLGKMKKGSYLINASRGTVVDLSALRGAIEEKHLAGAAIDVYPEEPKSNSESFACELQGLDNVILTPHIGGSTEEAQKAIGIEVSETLVRFLKTGATAGAVNFPEVEVQPRKEVHRIINIHRNVPGVLKEINSIVSSHGANILAQSLATDPYIGYLVMDLDKELAENVYEDISRLKTNIRTRILSG